MDPSCNLPVKWGLLDAKLHLFSHARVKHKTVAIHLPLGAGIPDIIQSESWRERSFSLVTWLYSAFYLVRLLPRSAFFL